MNDNHLSIKWHDPAGPAMRVNQKSGVTYLTFPALDALEGFRHGFTTRLGGVSEGCCSAMNLSFTRGDAKSAVWENYDRLCAAMEISRENLVTSHQTHTTNVRVVTEQDRGCGITRPRTYENVDGMVTNVPGLVLITYYADCVPLYFIDPEHRAIGLSHSGWRGTASRMGDVTVKTMEKAFGTDPARLYAAIGPSICQDCYEVSEDVILEFQKTFPEAQWPALYYQKTDDKYQLNLWEANRIILAEAGVPESHISMPNLCTCCNPDLLFSHRASGGKRGNLAALLTILE